MMPRGIRHGCAAAATTAAEVRVVARLALGALVAVAAGLDVGIAARGPEAAGARLCERSAELSHEVLLLLEGLMELMGVLIFKLF
jgi:hypothetical protein